MQRASRRSFLAKYKRTTNHGKLLPEMETSMYSDPVIIESDSESPSSGVHSLTVGDSPSLDSRPSKDGGDSFGRKSSSIFRGDDDHGLHPPEITKQRHSMLRKFGFHK